MVKGKVRELIFIRMATVMKGNGRMIERKVMESSIGKPGTVMMAIIMKGSLRMV